MFIFSCQEMESFISGSSRQKGGVVLQCQKWRCMEHLKAHSRGHYLLIIHWLGVRIDRHNQTIVHFLNSNQKQYFDWSLYISNSKCHRTIGFKACWTGPIFICKQLVNPLYPVHVSLSRNLTKYNDTMTANKMKQWKRLNNIGKCVFEKYVEIRIFHIFSLQLPCKSW